MAGWSGEAGGAVTDDDAEAGHQKQTAPLGGALGGGGTAYRQWIGGGIACAGPADEPGEERGADQADGDGRHGQRAIGRVPPQAGQSGPGHHLVEDPVLAEAENRAEQGRDDGFGGVDPLGALGAQAQQTQGGEAAVPAGGGEPGADGEEDAEGEQDE